MTKYISLYTSAFVLSLLFGLGHAHACQWRVEVKDRETKELKYYVADDTDRTEFIVNTSDGKPFAVCAAKVDPEPIKKEFEHNLEYVVTALLMCSYISAPEYPIVSSASKFVGKDGVTHSNPIIMTLLSVPDKGQKLKSLFTIRFSCR